MQTAIAYIDGFNFYHGAVRTEPTLKWADYRALCQALLVDHRLLVVRHYTARVTDRPTDPHQSQRQDVYLRALAAHGGVEIVYGQFRTRSKRVRTTKGEWVWAEVTEEKGSDVNLASDLVWDASHDAMDCALVVSNYFDLQRPIDRAIEAGVEVIVVNPHRKGGQRPAVNGSATRNLRRHHLRDSQLPNPVTGPDGRPIHRPIEWS